MEGFGLGLDSGWGRGLNSGSGITTRSERSIVASGEVEARK
jgi:hypothetical protein